jgi:hypothetical protein
MGCTCAAPCALKKVCCGAPSWSCNRLKLPYIPPFRCCILPRPAPTRPLEGSWPHGWATACPFPTKVPLGSRCLLISEMCNVAFSWVILLLCPLYHTTRAFMGLCRRCGLLFWVSHPPPRWNCCSRSPQSLLWPSGVVGGQGVLFINNFIMTHKKTLFIQGTGNKYSHIFVRWKLF